jgi:hypothetical protein
LLPHIPLNIIIDTGMRLNYLLNMYVCIYIYTSKYIYMYMNIYIYIYIHIHIHIYRDEIKSLIEEFFSRPAKIDHGTYIHNIYTYERLYDNACIYMYCIDMHKYKKSLIFFSRPAEIDHGMYIFICMFMYMYVYICIYIYIRKFIKASVYKYVHLHTYIYWYI